MHKLSVTFHPISKAKARFWFIHRPVKEVVSGDNFDASFSIENLGNADFPGGEIRFTYKSPIHIHSASARIPKVKSGERVESDPIELRAAAAGDASVFCEIISNDSKPVDCAGDDIPSISKCIGYSDGSANKPQFWFRIVPREALSSRNRQGVIIGISVISVAIGLANFLSC